MSFPWECGHCGRQYNLRDDMAGKKVVCKECGQATKLPERSAQPARVQAVTRQTAPATAATQAEAEPNLLADMLAMEKPSAGGKGEPELQLKELDSIPAVAPRKSAPPAHATVPRTAGVRTGPARLAYDDAGSAAPMVAGILILLTIILPWVYLAPPPFVVEQYRARGQQPPTPIWIMSWDLNNPHVGESPRISSRSSGVSFPTNLIIIWITGAVAIGATIFLHGLPRYITLAAAGVICLLILLIGSGASGLLSGGSAVNVLPSAMRLRVGMLRFILFLLPLTMLVLAVQRRLGEQFRGMRWTSGIAAGITGVLVLVLFILLLTDLSKWNEARTAAGAATSSGATPAMFQIAGFLLPLGIIAGCGVAVAVAAGLRLGENGAATANRILAGTLGATVVLVLLGMWFSKTGGAGFSWFLINVSFIIGALGTIIGAGVGATMAHLILQWPGQAVGGAPVAVGSAGGAPNRELAKRLADLEKARQAGMISDDEYAAMRAKVLSEV